MNTIPELLDHVSLLPGVASGPLRGLSLVLGGAAKVFHVRP